MLPAIALGVSRLLELDPVLTASLLVFATAPGGPVLVKLATLVKGDPALAVGLVVILPLVGVTTQPLVLSILLDGVTVSAGAIVRTLIFTVLAPLLIGLALRARRPLLAAWLQLPLRRVSTISMVLVVTLCRECTGARCLSFPAPAHCLPPCCSSCSAPRRGG